MSQKYTDQTSDVVTLPNNPSNRDAVASSVDDEIRRAIRTYGADAVKQSVKSLTKAKKGRKPAKDWLELRDVIEADAKIWLEGKDPFQLRSNYSIARDFAHKNPGQSASSTHQRIERKLRKKPHDRLWFTLMAAESLSREAYPHLDHYRALNALAELPPEDGRRNIWQKILQFAVNDIAAYQAKFGEYPAERLSMKEVEDAVRNPLLGLVPSKGLGLSGLLAPIYPSSGQKSRDKS